MLIIGVGNGNPLQYSCLENYMDRRVWQATVHGTHKESDTTERLDFTYPKPIYALMNYFKVNLLTTTKIRNKSCDPPQKLTQGLAQSQHLPSSP